MDTLAKLISDVLAALGYPPSFWLEAEDVARACVKSLAFFDISLTQSNQNQVIAKKEFTPASREVSLTDVRGVPLWVERKEGTEPNEVWVYVPAANLATVEEARERGEARVAFFAENNQLKVRFSYNPSDYGNRPHRLRYDPDPNLEYTPETAIALPAKFYQMYSARAVLDALQMLEINAANSEDKPTEAHYVAWSRTATRQREILDEMRPLWNQHRLGSRGGARGRNRRPVLAR